jgi:hypothetical protein
MNTEMDAFITCGEGSGKFLDRPRRILLSYLVAACEARVQGHDQDAIWHREKVFNVGSYLCRRYLWHRVR